MTAVRARQLTKRFQTRRAVDGVDLVLDEGELRGLLGPNGAGKTTLLRMLFGLVRPDGGTIELFGHTLQESDPLALDGVAGFVEDPRFYPYLSGRANLELLAELDGPGARARIDDVLEQVQLAGRAGDRLNGYSSGMRQRLGIAAALMRAPRLLLLDEPTAGLDPAGVRLIGGLLRRLSDSGVAVLLSSHQIGEVEGICDSFDVLSAGRVVWHGTALQMRSDAPPSAYWIVTSDDRLALELAREARGVHAEYSPRGGLTVQIEDGALDHFVLALGRADVAVRRLEMPVGPLESMFFALTDQAREDLPLAAPVAAEPASDLAHNVGPEQ